ncbi:MAG TPA: 50S ribosomal protein L4 [Acidimicrobiia bacterium]|nr:50S ribosomal protein L4 [Acidimicrobiia bacterium]
MATAKQTDTKAEVKAALFNSDGLRLGEVKLDPEIFGIEPNLAVLHQVVTAQLAGARAGTHKTKKRSEVRGGGAKPWRQKGTGRARAGSIRAPQWRGGGVAHGPEPRDYSQRTPKKMRRLALLSALSARAAEEAVVVVESFDWTTPKTRAAAGLLAAVGARGKTLLVLNSLDEVAGVSFRNLPQVVISEPGHLTAYDVLWARNVIFTTQTVAAAGGGHAYDVSKSDFVREGEA